MAAEKNNQKAEDIQKTDIPDETAKNVSESQETEHPSVKRDEKKGGFGKIFFVLLIIVVAVLFGIPQTREMILAKYREVVPATDVAIVPEKAVEPEEVVNRLEQLENARDFENAEVVVATVEPIAPVVATEQAVVVLSDQQKVLLAEIERLRTEIHQVRLENAKQIDVLRASMPKTGLLEERLLATAAREDALEQQMAESGVKIGRLEKNKADASAVLSLMTRMEITEQKMRASSVEKDRAVALLLAAYQMREAAMSGQNFLVEQQSALALASSSPRIAGFIRSLSVSADQGVWTRAALIQSFNAYADRAVLSEEISPKTDWFHKALNSLKKLVVIRRIDTAVDDGSTQAVLARAQQAVAQGDLGVAVIQLKTLKGTAAETMKDWTQAAERYLVTKKTINETIAAILGVIYAEQLKGE